MHGSENLGSVLTRAEGDLHRGTRTMILVRWLAVPWVLFQILAYEIPYPTGYKTLAFAFLVSLIVANVCLTIAHHSLKGLGFARLIGLLGLGVDVAILSAFVWLYAFDYQTQIWAVLFIAPLEGAILFQLAGAMTAWVVIAASYAFREVWAHEKFGNPLLWNSVTFRMGIGGIIALVAGLMARDLLKQRKRLADALEEVQRVDRMRSGLVSMLGHDVRSPLTVIRGVISTLISRDATVTPHDRQTLLESADRQARRLEALANDLLDLARLDEGRIELDKREVDVEGSVRTSLAYIEDSEDIHVDIEEGLTILVDPSRFEQILINLVNNAMKHGAPPIEIHAQSHGHIASIEVVDHGKGVPEKEMGRLFEPFNAERKSGSVGYGLAIVKALVEAHEGTIAYAHGKDGGAHFRVTFPAVPSAPKQAAEPSPEMPASA